MTRFFQRLPGFEQALETRQDRRLTARHGGNELRHGFTPFWAAVIGVDALDKVTN